MTGYTKGKRTYKPRAKKTFKKTNKRKSEHRKNKVKTSKEKNLIMTDNKMCKFDFIQLSSGYNLFGTDDYSNSDTNGRGGLPFSFSTGNDADLIAFSPSWDISPGVPSVLNSMRLIPGNSLIYVTQSAPVGTVYFSDKFEQTQPLGIQQWDTFYTEYLVHGSAIEVTLVDCTTPCQLVVIPVTTQDGGESPNSILQPYDYFPSTGTPANVNDILTFKTIVDDNPHAKVKLVSQTGGMDKVKIKHKMLTKQLYDIKILKDDDNNKALVPFSVTSGDAAYGNNPQANQWVWMVLVLPVVPPAAGTPLNICQAQIKVTYFCELTNRKQLNYVANQ